MDTTTTLPAASPAAPFTLAPKFENIPAEQRAMRQWIVWAHTWKDGEQKFAKVPSDLPSATETTPGHRVRESLRKRQSQCRMIDGRLMSRRSREGCPYRRG